MRVLQLKLPLVDHLGASPHQHFLWLRRHAGELSQAESDQNGAQEEVSRLAHSVPLQVLSRSLNANFPTQILSRYHRAAAKRKTTAQPSQPNAGVVGWSKRRFKRVIEFVATNEEWVQDWDSAERLLDLQLANWGQQSGISPMNDQLRAVHRFTHVYGTISGSCCVCHRDVFRFG